MAELVLLRFQILEIVRVRRDLDRHRLDDVQAIAFQADDLARVVGQQADVAHAEIDKDLRADAVLPKVHAVAEALVGFNGIEALLLLQAVGLKLGQQADAAAFLAHVEDDAPAGLGDLGHGLVELGAAIAEHALENVAGQALAVDAHEDRLGLHWDGAVDLEADAAHAQGQVRLGVHQRSVGDQVESAEPRRLLDDQLAPDEAFALPAKLDEVLDGAHFEAVLLAELAEIGEASHVAVGGHDLDDDGRLLEAGEAGEVD